METLNEFDQLISQWAAAAELEGVQVENGCVGIVLQRTHPPDEFVAIHLEEDKASNTVVMHTVIGEIDSANRDKVLTGLMRANACWIGTGGATLGLGEDDRAVVLCYRETLADMGPNRLDVLLETFAKASETWMDQLDEWNQAAGDDPPPDGDIPFSGQRIYG